MYFYTFSQSNMIVFLFISTESTECLFSFFESSRIFFNRMDCEGENVSADVLRCGANSAHLFNLQSD